MSLIDFHPYQLSLFITTTNTKKTAEVNIQNKPKFDSDKKPQSFREFLSEAEEK